MNRIDFAPLSGIHSVPIASVLRYANDASCFEVVETSYCSAQEAKADLTAAPYKSKSVYVGDNAIKHIFNKEKAFMKKAPTPVSAQNAASGYGPMIRAKEAYQRLGIARPTFYAWIWQGKLPQGILLSPGARVWPVSWIETFISKCAEENPCM